MARTVNDSFEGILLELGKACAMLVVAAFMLTFAGLIWSLVGVGWLGKHAWRGTRHLAREGGWKARVWWLNWQSRDLVAALRARPGFEARRTMTSVAGFEVPCRFKGHVVVLDKRALKLAGHTEETATAALGDGFASMVVSRLNHMGCFAYRWQRGATKETKICWPEIGFPNAYASFFGCIGEEPERFALDTTGQWCSDEIVGSINEYLAERVKDGCVLELKEIRSEDPGAAVLHRNRAMLKDHEVRSIRETDRAYLESEERAVIAWLERLHEIDQAVLGLQKEQEREAEGVMLTAKRTGNTVVIEWKKTSDAGFNSRVLGYREVGGHTPDPYAPRERYVIDSWSEQGQAVDRFAEEGITHAYTVYVERHGLGRASVPTVGKYERFEMRMPTREEEHWVMQQVLGTERVLHRVQAQEAGEARRWPAEFQEVLERFDIVPDMLHALSEREKTALAKIDGQDTDTETKAKDRQTVKHAFTAAREKIRSLVFGPAS